MTKASAAAVRDRQNPAARRVQQNKSGRTETWKQRLKSIDPMWYWVAAFLLAYFLFCLYWASIVPMDKAPDEPVRIPINDYIMQYGHLPNAWEESVRIHNWGFSYALRPVLVSIFSAFNMKIASLFSGDLGVQLLAVRLVSVFSAVSLVYYMFRIGRGLGWQWRWVWGMGVFTALIPQVTFLASYHNNDIFSMACCASVVYAWIHGINTNWSWKSCVRLSIAMGFTILSYYNAYPFVLFSIPVFFMTAFHKGMSKEEKKLAWKKTGAIVLMTFLIAGWWFIRNIILYNGDVTGSITREIMGEQFAIPGLRPSEVTRLKNQGVPFKAVFNSTLLALPWWKITFMSSWCVVGYVELYLETQELYWIILGILETGCVLCGLAWLTRFVQGIRSRFKDKDQRRDLIVLFFCCLAAMLVFLLSMYYSWTDDYQPQGRYVLPALVSYILIMFYGFRSLFELITKWIPLKKFWAGVEIVLLCAASGVNICAQVEILDLMKTKFAENNYVSIEYIDHRIEYGPAFETDGNGQTWAQDVDAFEKRGGATVEIYDNQVREEEARRKASEQGE